MYKFIFLLVLTNLNNAHAQIESSQLIDFQPKFGQSILEVNKSYYSNSLLDSIQINKLEFYISNLKFYKKNTLVHQDTKIVRLLSLEDPSTFQLKTTIPNDLKYNYIEFSIGVDSTTSVSGAFGGDLDPIHGMYWAWQSGYINFKLEGIAKACPSRNNEFSFHIGGYQAPYYALRSVRLKVKRNKDIQLSIDLDKFISAIDISTTFQVMSPNDASIQLADMLPAIFLVSK